ncbi:MAG: tetratricopeptide repeat protein, partial [Asticcacaulis sp.]|nr:tetratricopeptide repeat protein [Asticcacaulis sp.]
MAGPGDDISQRAVAAALSNPRLVAAALDLHDNRIPEAEQRLRAHLKDDPFDVAAIRLLAEVAARIGRFRDSETLLRRALELAPGFGAARANLATVLYRQNRPVEAIAELDHLMGDDRDTDSLGPANLKAAALGRLGEFEEALGLYEAILKDAPNQPRVWMSYAHTLKTVGRSDDGIAAYRRALDLNPHLGEVWWSLANLKTYRFSDADVAAMRRALEVPGLSDADRLHLDFALGKALEDRRDFAAAFSHYAAGNALRKASDRYDPDAITTFVDQSIALFTPDFFAARKGVGCEARDPVFILGMPRAGSTLIEQILSSHSKVEGTQELPDMPFLARRGGRYPAHLA